VLANVTFLLKKPVIFLLQLPLVKSTRDNTILSLDGSWQVQQQEESDIATVPSILDHYVQQPCNSAFENMTLIYFAQNYTMPKSYLPKFEQYCKQKLMLHVPF